jgi:hypothetical protein
LTAASERGVTAAVKHGRLAASLRFGAAESDARHSPIAGTAVDSYGIESDRCDIVSDVTAEAMRAAGTIPTMSCARSMSGEVLLTARRHVDYGRVRSAMCPAR